MPVTVELHSEFERWLLQLDVGHRHRILGHLGRLEELGAMLRAPYATRLKSSARIHELRISIKGREFRLLYAFKRDRNALVLLGGDKTGAWKSWYVDNVKVAEERLAEVDK